MEKKELLSEVAEITAKTLVSTIPVGGNTCYLYLGFYQSKCSQSQNGRLEESS